MIALAPADQLCCCFACVVHIENISREPAFLPTEPMFFTFPDDARWNAARQAVEFGVEIGEYLGVVRIPRRVFQRLLSDTPLPSVVLKRITCSEHALSEPPNGSCGGVYCPRTGTSKSLAAICVRALPRFPGALNCDSRNGRDARRRVHREPPRRGRAVPGSGRRRNSPRGAPDRRRRGPHPRIARESLAGSLLPRSPGA